MGRIIKFPSKRKKKRLPRIVITFQKESSNALIDIQRGFYTEHIPLMNLEILITYMELVFGRYTKPLPNGVEAICKNPSVEFNFIDREFNATVKVYGVHSDEDCQLLLFSIGEAMSYFRTFLE